MKEKILEELYRNKEAYISGQALSKKLGISRTAVWKHMKSLKEEGYHIETIPRKGYGLLDMEDQLLPKEIERVLLNHTIGKKIIYFQSIDSTNSYAKKEANQLEEGTLILSEEQVAGRGRRGRGWVSPKGRGIWMSVVLKPNIGPGEGVKITQVAAAAACQTIREVTGLEALIKWPNDIVINHKKVCGILTEMAGELTEVSYIIVGIGINVNIAEFPEELRERATSLFIEGGKKIDRRLLVVEFLETFEALYDGYIKNLNLEETLDIIRKYSAVLGKEIRIIQGPLEKRGKVVDINEDGALLVEMIDGQKELISSGEVSIRGKNGYI